jgi:hypothetical protein
MQTAVSICQLESLWKLGFGWFVPVPPTQVDRHAS